MATIREPTPEEAIILFKAIEERFPHKTVGDDKWYLVTISALLASVPHQVGTLYTYMINKPEFQSPESRKILVRRIREALIKNISVQGVSKSMEALFTITAVERPEDMDFSCSREDWRSGPENIARGEAWLRTIYQDNLTDAMKPFTAHRDFALLTREITYGFYLSDRHVLDDVDTELIVLAGIMSQNLPTVTAWHLRGTRRVGVSAEDCELIQQCIEMVAKFGGISLHKVPRVADIEHEVASQS